jgi:hypothetical protein
MEDKKLLELSDMWKTNYHIALFYFNNNIIIRSFSITTTRENLYKPGRQAKKCERESNEYCNTSSSCGKVFDSHVIKDIDMVDIVVFLFSPVPASDTCMMSIHHWSSENLLHSAS